ncbi:MAG: hypothetical protein AAFO15_00145 [Pseudomonadota bacterium]
MKDDISEIFKIHDENKDVLEIIEYECDEGIRRKILKKYAIDNNGNKNLIEKAIEQYDEDGDEDGCKWLGLEVFEKYEYDEQRKLMEKNLKCMM